MKSTSQCQPRSSSEYTSRPFAARVRGPETLAVAVLVLIASIAFRVCPQGPATTEEQIVDCSRDDVADSRRFRRRKVPDSVPPAVKLGQAVARDAGGC